MFRSIFILTFLALISPALACCTAWRAGQEPVRIAAQEVLIVWDEETKTEHFIRRANFQAGKPPKDFGFLVPTPTQPKLQEVPDQIFQRLGELIKPKVEVKKTTRISFMPLLLRPLTATLGSKSAESANLRGGVEILDRAIVGGYEAVVLRAAHTDELLKWLELNEYDARPALRDWLTPYVKKEWIITAFKYAAEEKGAPPSLSRASVCMSFQTEEPFFPYRVPSDIRVRPENGSLLRLYFSGKERVVGTFENGNIPDWNAQTKFSNREDQVADILKHVGQLPQSASSSTWLTTFEDNTWPGGADDLYFKSSPTKESLIPPPIMRADVSTIQLPLDVIGVILIAGVLIYKKRKNAA